MEKQESLLRELIDRILQPREVFDPRDDCMMNEYIYKEVAELCTFEPGKYFEYRGIKLNYPNPDILRKCQPTEQEAKELEECEQGTKTWHDGRSRSSGSSGAAVIAGISHHYYEFRQMTILKFSGLLKPKTRHTVNFNQGHFLEHANRKSIKRTLAEAFSLSDEDDINIREIGMKVSPFDPREHTSPDGIVELGALGEKDYFKFPQSADSKVYNVIFAKGWQVDLNRLLVELKSTANAKATTTTPNFDYTVQCSRQMRIMDKDWNILSVLHLPYDRSATCDGGPGGYSLTVQSNSPIFQRLFMVQHDQEFVDWFEAEQRVVFDKVEALDFFITENGHDDDNDGHPKPKWTPMTLLLIGPMTGFGFSFMMHFDDPLVSNEPRLTLLDKVTPVLQGEDPLIDYFFFDQGNPAITMLENGNNKELFNYRMFLAYTNLCPPLAPCLLRAQSNEEFFTSVQRSSNIVIISQFEGTGIPETTDRPYACWIIHAPKIPMVDERTRKMAMIDGKTHPYIEYILQTTNNTASFTVWIDPLINYIDKKSSAEKEYSKFFKKASYYYKNHKSFSLHDGDHPGKQAWRSSETRTEKWHVF